MKKAIIVFIIIYLATALVPAASLIRSKSEKKQEENELVTIFNAGDYKTIQYFS